MRSISALIVLACFLVSKAQRLPITALPQSYIVDLTINDDDTFSGLVIITTKSFKQISQILLHCSEELDIGSVNVNGDVVEHSFITNDILAIYLTDFVKPRTELKIIIKFNGNVNDNNVGLYKGTYKDQNEDEHVFFATHFEATYARNVFPCFDEPFFKATFQISVTANDKFSVISNMKTKNFMK